MQIALQFTPLQLTAYMITNVHTADLGPSTFERTQVQIQVLVKYCEIQVLSTQVD